MVQIENNKGYLVEEFVLSDSNTTATSQYVDNWLTTHNFTGTLQTTGDASGSARRTVGTVGAYSDWVIIDSIFKNYREYQKRIKRSNPSIRNTVNALNSAFRTASGEIKIYINPKKCPMTHKDLMQQTYKEDGQLNDTGNIGHRSDALRYFADMYYPLQSEKTTYNY
jgi:hypothetical protein